MSNPTPAADAKALAHVWNSLCQHFDMIPAAVLYRTLHCVAMSYARGRGLRLGTAQNLGKHIGKVAGMEFAIMQAVAERPWMYPQVSAALAAVGGVTAMVLRASEVQRENQLTA